MTGVNRFLRAIPKKPWSGIRPAKILMYACMQPYLAPAQMSEDCLTLNIYTPSKLGNSLLPVMFWIHGGSFKYGYGGSYDGSNLAEQQNVIVVTTNYRLGPFGFFASNDLKESAWHSTGGTNGVLDQMEALKWVQANINAFGGDPDQVTIFGESAGSLSVCMLTISPLTKGLFRRSILESGSCVGPWSPATQTIGLRDNAAFMAAVGAKSISDLRALSALQLNAGDWPYGPSVDGVFLTDVPANMLKTGGVSLPPGTQVMLGSNTQDTIMAEPWYNGPWPDSSLSWEATVNKYFLGNSSEVVARYPGGPDAKGYKAAFVSANVDTCVRCPTKWLGDMLAAHELNLTVFMYSFGYNTNPKFAGAPHAAEIPLVFEDSSPSPKGFSYDATLARDMLGRWASFAKALSMGIWKPYTQSSQDYLQFGDGADISVVAKSMYETETCDFWETFYDPPEFAAFISVIEYCIQKVI